MLKALLAFPETVLLERLAARQRKLFRLTYELISATPRKAQHPGRIAPRAVEWEKAQSLQPVAPKL